MAVRVCLMVTAFNSALRVRWLLRSSAQSESRLRSAVDTAMFLGCARCRRPWIAPRWVRVT